MHGFCIFSGWGVGGGRKRPQNTVFWGPKRIHGVLRILAVFCPYSTESQNTQNTDRIRTMYSGGQNTSYSLRILCILFWWTEYRILSKKQNTDRIRTEYGQNTVITKRAIVITNRTPPQLAVRNGDDFHRFSSWAPPDQTVNARDRRRRALFAGTTKASPRR